MLQDHMLSPEKINTIKRVANSNCECPKCKSANIETQERGFKLGRGAVVSILLTPVIGVPLGMMGRKKLVNRCMDCGKIFKFKSSK